MNLFDPLVQRSLTLPNRLVISPMCQYSATDGLPDHWHLVHLGSRAVGGAALVITEATAVSAQGRISHGDAGLWSDAHVDAWKPIVSFVRSSGSIAGVQLAHAGRKSSAQRPWEGGGSLAADQQPWPTVAPSAIPFDAGWHTPQALDEAGIKQVVADFRATAQRALAAGFQLIELHAAHGYLLHQFLSQRHAGASEDSDRCRLSGAIRRTHPARGGYRHRRGRHDYGSGAGAGHHRQWRSGCSAHRPRKPA